MKIPLNFQSGIWFLIRYFYRFSTRAAVRKQFSEQHTCNDCSKLLLVQFTTRTKG